MKRQERYKILNYAKKEHSEKQNTEYKYKKLSQKALQRILKNHKHSFMCEWSYCCYGMYEVCWEELYKEGIWDMSQDMVDGCIKNAIHNTAKVCRKDSRILYAEKEDRIEVIIVARDVHKLDYMIVFSNEEGASYE